MPSSLLVPLTMRSKEVIRKLLSRRFCIAVGLVPYFVDRLAKRGVSHLPAGLSRDTANSECIVSLLKSELCPFNCNVLVRVPSHGTDFDFAGTLCTFTLLQWKAYVHTVN